MTLNDEERKFILKLVERELEEIERHESDFDSLLSNSPVLSQLLTSQHDIKFLASQERYHQFLKILIEKLK
jgi:hypothetical protein